MLWLILHVIVAQMEHVVSAGGYNEDFRGKMRSVLYNLKDEKNQDFRGKVLRGEVSPTRICHMESHDMASEVQSHHFCNSLHAPHQGPPQGLPRDRLYHTAVPLALQLAAKPASRPAGWSGTMPT